MRCGADRNSPPSSMRSSLGAYPNVPTPRCRPLRELAGPSERSGISSEHGYGKFAGRKLVRRTASRRHWGRAAPRIDRSAHKTPILRGARSASLSPVRRRQPLTRRHLAAAPSRPACRVMLPNSTTRCRAAAAMRARQSRDRTTSSKQHPPWHPTSCGFKQDDLVRRAQRLDQPALGKRGDDGGHRRRAASSGVRGSASKSD